MSVTETVFLLRAKLPTRDEWQRALTQHGFSLVFHPEFDPARDDGYVPCTLADADAGFEYFIQDIETYVAEQDCSDRRAQLGTLDTAVSFVTRSRFEDLQAAMAAAAVLATTSGGLLWSDEAGDFVDNLLQTARDFCKAEPPRPPPPPVESHPIAADLAARCVFRGQAMTILETNEATPQRFTIKLALREPEVRIVALWKHAVGSPTVHRLRVGGTLHELDSKGIPASARPITTSIAELGRTEIATRELLEAGAAAVIPLCEVVIDAQRPVEMRRMAIVILGQLRDRRAAPTLETFASDAELGAVARQALAKLS